MKKNKSFCIILFLLVSANYSFAQLASSNPVRSFYSSKTMAALDKNKSARPTATDRTRPALQSQKSMQEITMPATKQNRQTVMHPNNNLSTGQKKKILASNTITTNKKNNKYLIKKK